jgi:hypothetical protein
VLDPREYLSKLFPLLRTQGGKGLTWEFKKDNELANFNSSVLHIPVGLGKNAAPPYLFFLFYQFKVSILGLGV